MMQAEYITRSLGGKWRGGYGLCLCPAHANTKTPALSLSEGTDGRLLAKCHAGCDFRDIMDALRGLGLIEGGGTYTPPSAAEIAKREAADQEQAERTERKAMATWKETQPISGTIAETYLRIRGITCDLPDTMRYHPDCWHPTAKRYPAMVSLVEGLPRLAIHRTYLRPDGSGKAKVEPAKAMQGACAGGAVRVTRSQGKLPVQPLVVAEGIETALSLASGLLRTPATIWAALSAPGIAGLHLPDISGRLTIAADGDDAGHAAAHKLAERATALGWTVSMLPAPLGRDWNDILREKGATA